MAAVTARQRRHQGQSKQWTCESIYRDNAMLAGVNWRWGILRWFDEDGMQLYVGADLQKGGGRYRGWGKEGPSLGGAFLPSEFNVSLDSRLSTLVFNASPVSQLDLDINLICPLRHKGEFFLSSIIHLSILIQEFKPMEGGLAAATAMTLFVGRHRVSAQPIIASAIDWPMSSVAIVSLAMAAVQLQQQKRIFSQG